MELPVGTKPLFRVEAKTTHVYDCWMTVTVVTQLLVVSSTDPVRRLSCVTERAHWPLSGLLTGLTRDYSVPHQGSAEFEPGDFILSGGPTLLLMLEPSHMVSSFHHPPESLCTALS